MRIGAAQRQLSGSNGERFLSPGYACVPRADGLRRSHDTVLPKGAHFWYKGDDRVWWLEKFSASTTEDKVSLVRFWTTRDLLNFLFPRRATRLRPERYEALGACKFTSPGRFLGEPDVTWTNLEERP